MKKMIIIFSTLVFLIDRLTKIFVDLKFNFNESLEIIENFFSITFLKNDGAAFSMFGGQTVFLIVLTIIIVAILIKMIKSDKEITKIECLYYSIILGGILGNLGDRIYYGYVLDFLDFKIFTYDFAIFNVADMAIVLGAFIMIYDVLKGEFDARNKNRQ